MSRPENNRIVNQPPVFTEFKPTFVKGRELQNIYLSIDEFEAIRLADYAGLSHLEAAREMLVSRPTFSRLILKARKKMADFLILGRKLIIDGGNIHFTNNVLQCVECGLNFISEMDIIPENCPSCNSGQLRNLAHGFGHGNCCIPHNKKGGNYARGKQNRARRKGSNDR
ncbi:MAG: DUF134 domain-containing protein [Bacteroidales bacterium]|nr:DUF134 domain-containing protein [Bacteroidales bacterium]MCF8389541.1 DUF134 domain-containing protein [Bacteroidales bacterium]